MHNVLRALRCPVCAQLLDQPLTLRCGHTVCSDHLRRRRTCPVHRCPSGACHPPAAFLPRLADVTVSNVLDLVQRTQKELTKTPSDDSDTDDSEHNDDPSNSPPRKRRRRRRRSPDGGDVSEPDLLTHLSSQARLHRTTPAHVPLLDADDHRSPSGDDPAQPVDRDPDRLARKAAATAARPPRTRDEVLDAFEESLLNELGCQICYGVLYSPVTTPCQHTFCSRCLFRALDHSPACPACRQDLPAYSYFHDHPSNALVLHLLTQTLPILKEAYNARAEAIETEERNARLDTPIFVCQLSFPGMPTLLHFFEPRYRLMLRRCLESEKKCFGMIMPSRPGASSSAHPTQVEYGTMLEIRSVQMLSDGRSMVETWGTWRFRILERGTLDGYMVGRIERVDDFPDELDEPPPGQPELYPKEKAAEKAEPTDGPTARALSTPPSSSSLLRMLRPSRSTSSVLNDTAGAESSSSSSSQGKRVAPARIQRSTSSPPPPPEVPPLSTADLIAHCLAFLGTLQSGTAPWVSQRLNHAFPFAGLGADGDAPSSSSNSGIPVSLLTSNSSSTSTSSSASAVNPNASTNAGTGPGTGTIAGIEQIPLPLLSFYIATLLPIDEYEKAKLLPVRSARMRLQMCVWWIEGLRKHWWFEKGCVVF